MSRGKSKPYRVETSDLLGRYLVADRDLKPGEVILKESPLLVGPTVESSPICMGCYAPLAASLSTPMYRCSRCRLAPLCGVVCEKCGQHSDVECDALRQAAEKTSETPDMVNVYQNYQVIMPLRCLLLRESAPDKWEAFLGLEAHMEDRRGSPIWNSHQETVVKVLRSWGFLSPADDDDLAQRVCGILDVNSFEVRGPIVVGVPAPPETLRGVYLEAAMMAHDCIGNTHLAVDDSFEMTIHASVAIKEGQPIYFNYTSTMQGTDQRKEHLREGKYFECRCARCTDPTELGTHMSSLICALCTDGDAGFVTRSSPDLWTCSKCKKTHPTAAVETTVVKARDLLDEVDRSSPRDMESLLKKVSRIFAPNHSVVLELKQNLVALYRDIIAREPSPSRKNLVRKIELCRELLPVLSVIEPGISRLKGITMYEIHVPIVLLANREYQSEEITSLELLARMKEAEVFLREAVTQLLYEPANTPEHQLARVAMQELKDLRASMQDVERLNLERKPTGASKHGRRNKKRL